MVDTFNMTNYILSSFKKRETEQQVFVKNSSIKERSKGPGPEKFEHEKRMKRQMSKAANSEGFVHNFS